MKHLSWGGWLLAGVILLQTAATGLANLDTNPLDGHLLQHSGGTFYLYHSGVKFAVQLVDLGDPVIDAIPNATSEQRVLLFRDGSQLKPILPNRNPEPFPGHS
jgi:hypothetical protein